MRRRFFVERFTNGTARLQGESAYHLARVLRAETGQTYELSDGRDVYLAKVEAVGRESVDFVLGELVAARESRLPITLLLAIVKFDRFEWALEKATELGVTAIVPLAADRSEKGLVAAAAKRSERWRKLLMESAQQARCLRPPELHSHLGAAQAFIECSAGIRILLSERADARPMRRVLLESSAAESGAGGAADGADATASTHATAANIDEHGDSDEVAARADTQIAFAVGPEGGWTDPEFAAAAKAGFLEASIGGNILRTETAVVAGLAAMHFQFDN